MAQKKMILRMTIIVLAFSFVLLGCPNGITEKDTWSDVTDFSQLDGTWKGSYTQTRTMKERLESMGREWDDLTAAMFGDMKVTVSAQSTVTYKTAEKTVATSGITTSTFSGGNIAIGWPMIRETMTVIPEQMGTVEPDDKNHSLKITFNEPAKVMEDRIIAGILAQGIQINQNRTKFKMPAIKEAGTPEIIMIRQ